MRTWHEPPRDPRRRVGRPPRRQPAVRLRAVRAGHPAPRTRPHPDPGGHRPRPLTPPHRTAHPDERTPVPMPGETVITIIGNLTADPELRFTPSGAAVANFTVASTPRQFDRQAQEPKDGETLFMRCSVWRDTAENVAESLAKGNRVIVQGRLVQRSFETREGEKRTVVELQVEEVGASLKYASATVTRQPRKGGEIGRAHV